MTYQFASLRSLWYHFQGFAQWSSLFVCLLNTVRHRSDFFYAVPQGQLLEDWGNFVVSASHVRKTAGSILDSNHAAGDELSKLSLFTGILKWRLFPKQFCILHTPLVAAVTPKFTSQSQTNPPGSPSLGRLTARKHSSHQSPSKFLWANGAADILHVASDVKNQLSESIEAFQSLTRELTAKVMQGGGLPNLISTAPSSPGSLSLITA